MVAAHLVIKAVVNFSSENLWNCLEKCLVTTWYRCDQVLEADIQIFEFPPENTNKKIVD